MTTATRPSTSLAIDTIRTLSIDGVQKANSGHPGAPMGAAPMAYALWTRFLRHAPTHPDWPDRDRFVLSAGHASMLLYSLLHLTGYDLSLDDLECVPPVGLADARPPGVRPDARASRRRPGRSARASRTRSGWRSPSVRLAAEFNRDGHDDRRPPDVRHLLRRRPPGGHRVRGAPASPATSASASSSSSTTTTTSSSTDRPRWPGRRTSRPGSRPTAGTRQRVDDGNDIEAIAAAIEAARADDRPSLIAVRTHIGFGSPNKQDTPEGARLAARPRRGPPDQGGLRLGSGPDVLRARPRRSRCSAGPIPRGEDAGRRLGGAARRAIAPRSRPRPRSSCAGSTGDAPPTAGTPGSRPTRPARSSRRGNASQDAIQALAEPRPGAVRRRGRPVRVEPDRRQGRADDFSADEAGPEPAVRRPRARDGRDRQRHRVPRRVHPVRRHVPDVQRLHARLRPAGRAGRAPRHLRLDPRLGRARRGRPDPPAGRALRRAAGDPEPVVRPAGRRQRDVGGVGARGRAPRTARSRWR